MKYKILLSQCLPPHIKSFHNLIDSNVHLDIPSSPLIPWSHLNDFSLISATQSHEPETLLCKNCSNTQSLTMHPTIGSLCFCFNNYYHFDHSLSSMWPSTTDPLNFLQFITPFFCAFLSNLESTVYHFNHTLTNTITPFVSLCFAAPLWQNL